METKKEFSILLHIVEGIGLNDANGEVSLAVTLNDTKIYLNGNKTKNSIIFNSNCIWECKFDDLKRMKTNDRIKIDCFDKIIQNNKETTRAIGFILLPIRKLPTIKTVKNCEIKLKWYKLRGLRKEWRQSKPEIYLYAIITTKDLINSGQLEEFLDPKPVDSLDSTVPENEPASALLTNEGAGGDMVHKDKHEHEHELQVQSARHERVKEISPKAPKSDRSVNYKSQAKEPDKNHAYKIFDELEDWKRQQNKLQHTLREECNKMTEKLEAAQRAVNEKTIKKLEKEARQIKNDMDYELEVQKLDYKELQIEKDRISEENVKLKEKLLQMEQELEHMKKNYLPKEQHDRLF